MHSCLTFPPNPMESLWQAMGCMPGEQHLADAERHLEILEFLLDVQLNMAKSQQP